MDCVHAPYNFVPFPSTPLYRYNSQSELPGSNTLETGLKTGEIHISIQAETPLFVGASSEQRGFFYRDAENRLAIPGSSVRGLIRSNVQILGMAPVRPDDLGELPGCRLLAVDSEKLDYVLALFGWAQRASARRSRLSFETLRADWAQTDDPVRLLRLTPDYHHDKYYLLDGKTTRDHPFEVRGLKAYWMKEPCRSDTYDRRASELWPVQKGSRFSGVIRYRNLHPDELGLLLWVLRLEEGCRMSLGAGKAYGYGRVKVEIEQLLELNPAEQYSLRGLSMDLKAAPDGAVDRYIDAYDAFACELYQTAYHEKIRSLRELERLKDFFYLRRKIVEAGEAEYRREGGPMATVAQLRAEQPLREAAATPPLTKEDALQALREKFGGGGIAAARPAARKKKKK